MASTLVETARRELLSVFPLFAVGASQQSDEAFGNAVLDLYADPLILRLTKDRGEFIWEVGPSAGPNELYDDVASLITSGEEMKAILVLSKALAELSKLHNRVSSLYGLIYRNSRTLKHFGSKRFEQLGHEPKSTRELIKAGGDNAVAGQSDDFIASFVLDQIKTVGIKPKKHWLVEPVFLAELEYMLHVLAIMMEADFIIPVLDDLHDPAINRGISRSVKVAVWRRDQGQCVDCGSNERLEFDHIIPVIKGGSCTERNVQLLCETCNRHKAAQIG